MVLEVGSQACGFTVNCHCGDGEAIGKCSMNAMIFKHVFWKGLGGWTTDSIHWAEKQLCICDIRSWASQYIHSWKIAANDNHGDNWMFWYRTSLLPKYSCMYNQKVLSAAGVSSKRVRKRGQKAHWSWLSGYNTGYTDCRSQCKFSV